MLRMTISELDGYQCVHHVYKDGVFLGSIAVWNDHMSVAYRDICACYVRDFSVVHPSTLTAAVSWLRAKEMARHV